MQRMIARRRGGTSAGAGQDGIIFGVSLPSGSIVHNIQSRMVIERKSLTATAVVHAYAIEGYVFPVVDPEAAVTFKNIWDTLVPKDTDTQVLDLDTGTADATNFFEPGEADWSQLIQIGMRPKRIFQRIRILTPGGPPNNGAVQVDTTLKWYAHDSFVVNIRRPIRVSRPSVVMFAVSSPNMDDTTQTGELSLAESEWGRVKYISEVMNMSMLHLLGVTTAAEEATAESSWEQATDLLQKQLEPDVLEDSGMTWEPVTWAVNHDTKVNMSVVGNFEKMTLTTGR